MVGGFLAAGLAAGLVLGAACILLESCDAALGAAIFPAGAAVCLAESCAAAGFLAAALAGCAIACAPAAVAADVSMADVRSSRAVRTEKRREDIVAPETGRVVSRRTSLRYHFPVGRLASPKRVEPICGIQPEPEITSVRALFRGPRRARRARTPETTACAC